MVNSELVAGKIVCPDTAQYGELTKRGLGGRKTDVVSPLEALFLVKQGELTVAEEGKKILFPALLKKLKATDKELERRYLVYDNLRSKGYLPKSGFKFGCDFNVYPKGALPADPAAHGKFLVKVIKPTLRIGVQDMALRVRLSQNVRKQLYFACSDTKQKRVEYVRARYITP